MAKTVCCFLAFVVISCSVSAQTAPIAAKLGYPELIVHNGKVVTMDDASFESNVGTIAQAMAVRGDKILAVGSNADIRALAGPQTRLVDLRGRTVLPSFIMSHEHPTDWAFQEPSALRHVLGGDNNDVLITRWMEPKPAAEQFAAFEGVLKDALSHAKPGQWILLSFNWGPDYEYSVEIEDQFTQHINKARLDQLAPNNPVKVKNGFITSIINSKALEELKKVHEPLSMFQRPAATAERVKKYEQDGLDFGRPVEPDVAFQGKTELLGQVLNAEMELWAANGVTTFGSSPYAYHNFQALSQLSKSGKMSGRFAWGYNAPNFEMDTLRYVAGMLGHGNDYLWNIGAWAGGLGSCTTIEASPAVKSQERCTLEPGTGSREMYERIVRAGGRIATMHSGGDKDIDYLLDIIEKGSKDAGLTIEQVRAKRHAFDHASGAPRPDQIPRLKNLGMMVSMINTVLWETHRGASVTARDYGIEYANWVVPRNSVTKGGVMNTFEIDRPLPQKVFFFIHKGITRYNDKDKRVYGAKEATDRIIQLKALTTWGGYYVLRENLLGTLEAGKYADFIVLDRDYLTIPEADIPNVQVLLTSVGGRIVHLRPALADEMKTPPVGPVTWSPSPLAK